MRLHAVTVAVLQSESVESTDSDLAFPSLSASEVIGRVGGATSGDLAGSPYLAAQSLDMSFEVRRVTTRGTAPSASLASRQTLPAPPSVQASPVLNAIDCYHLLRIVAYRYSQASPVLDAINASSGGLRPPTPADLTQSVANSAGGDGNGDRACGGGLSV